MRKLFVILFFASLLLSASTSQQSSDDTNAKIKTVFLYNFTKYIEWPKQYKEGEFVIGVLGSNGSLLKELDKMSYTKKAGNQNFHIKAFSSISDIGKCHILFIPSENGQYLSEVTEKLKGKSTLIVTEKPGLAKQGAAINFVIQNNKQMFELNKANAEKHHLFVSSNLSALAIVVE